MPRPADRPSGRQPHRLPLLILLGIACALIYAVALLRFPLLPIYDLPLQNLDKLTHSDRLTGAALAACVLVLFAGYAAGALLLVFQRGIHQPRRHGAHGDSKRIAPPPYLRGEPLRGSDAVIAARQAEAPARALMLVAIAFPLIFLALLLLVYPTTSVDLYDYLFRGRMIARYEANTFVLVPQDFKSDPLYSYVAWKRAVTAYGPLWEGMSWLTARLAGEAPGATATGGPAELLRLLLAYKGLSALGFLLCGAAIWGALGRAGRQWRLLGLYLWLWNPLALWETVAAGHNDAWMALLIVLALWALYPDQRPPTNGERQMMSERRHSAPGTRHPTRRSELVTQHSTLNTQALARPILSLLALTAGGLIKFLALFLGPVLLSAALRRLDSWRARWRLVLLGGTACAAATALAYAPFWAGWRTFQNFGDRGTLFTASWLAMIEELLARSLPEQTAQGIAAGLGLGLLVLGMGWAAWRAWRAPQDVPTHTLWLLLWFLFFCNPWFQPWYLLWALALVALQPWRTRLVLGVGLFCCTAMLSYVAGSFLLPALGRSVGSAEWDALVSTLIYVPPLLVMGWGYRARGISLLRGARRLGRTWAARRRVMSS